MSFLTIVRHGQASFGADDYDHLSAVGRAHACALARHWIDTGFACEHAFVGPLRRHRQTWEALAEEMARAGRPLPRPEYLPELDEHQGRLVFRNALPGLVARNPELGRMLARGAPPEEYRRRYLKLFAGLASSWAEGRHVDPEHESWQAFRTRIGQVLPRLLRDAAPRDHVLVIASGGTVAAVTGAALDLDDGKTMELNYMVRNASFSEYLYSPRRLALSTFNAVPHLRGNGAPVTYL